MYFGALIQLPDGSRVVAKGLLGVARYAKKENKLVKVVCDDVRALPHLEKFVKEQHPKATVEFGVEGTLEMELNQNEPQEE